MLAQLNDRINQAVKGLAGKVNIPAISEITEAANVSTTTEETLLIKITTSALTTAANDTYTITLNSPVISADSVVFITIAWLTNTQGTAIPINIRKYSGYIEFEVLNLDYSGLALAFNGTLEIAALIYN